MMDYESAEVVAMLIAAFPSWKPSHATTLVYQSELEDLDYSVAKASVRHLIRTSRFCPTIAELREAALEATQGVPRSGASAYGDVMAAIRKHGRTYGGEPAPLFEDPLIAECIRIWGGSWNAVCDSPDNDPAGRARFIELYDNLAKRERRLAQVSDGLRLPDGEQPKQLGSNVVDLLAKVGRTLK